MKWRYYGLEWLGDEGSNYQYERREGKILEVRTEYTFSRQLQKYLQNSYQNSSICAKINQPNKQKIKHPILGFQFHVVGGDRLLHSGGEQTVTVLQGYSSDLVCSKCASCMCRL